MTNIPGPTCADCGGSLPPFARAKIRTDGRLIHAEGCPAAPSPAEMARRNALVAKVIGEAGPTLGLLDPAVDVAVVAMPCSVCEVDGFAPDELDASGRCTECAP